jgi:uncharacterized protein (DUF58 family)
VEYAIRTACAIAAAAVSEGHEIQLFGEGEAPIVVPMGSGDGHLGYLLGELALVKAKGTTPIHDVLTRYADRVPQGSQVFLIMASVAGDPADFAEGISFLRGRHARVQALLIDDRTFVQHHKWKRELSQDAYPPLAQFLVGTGADVRLIPRGADILATLQED